MRERQIKQYFFIFICYKESISFCVVYFIDYNKCLPESVEKGDDSGDFLVS